jgi:hypothetical protein
MDDCLWDPVLEPKEPTPTIVLQNCINNNAPLVESFIEMDHSVIMQNTADMDITLSFAYLLASYWVFGVKYCKAVPHMNFS